MRDKIVERIRRHLNAKDPGRYAPVFELLFKLEARLPPATQSLTREQHKIFKYWSVDGFDWSLPDDTQLLDIYELVMRRFATQR